MATVRRTRVHGRERVVAAVALPLLLTCVVACQEAGPDVSATGQSQSSAATSVAESPSAAAESSEAVPEVPPVCPDAGALSGASGTQLSVETPRPVDGAKLQCDFRDGAQQISARMVVAAVEPAGAYEQIVAEASDTPPPHPEIEYLAWERGEGWLLGVQRSGDPTLLNGGTYATAPTITCYAQVISFDAARAEAVEKLTRELSTFTRGWCAAPGNFP